jgi:dihydroflavonol-4-reductase
MKAFVTGATGFVGGHVARALVERGDEVRCLVRETSPLSNVDGLPLETVRGDLTDAESVLRAVRGCDRVFHCAADYRLWVPDPEAMYAANVEGTRNVLRAAAEYGCDRLVYTSTVGALGLEGKGEAADESTPVDYAAMVGHYKKSKYVAERVAEEWAARGLAVVIVNPSAPVGEGDIKPTATGQMIVDFLDGRMSAYVDTGLNLIDVRDVARGHLLAAERGRPGEKYILGCENLTLKQILDRLSAITGIPAPRIKLPHWVPLTFSALDTFLARPLGRTPRVPLDAVRLARKKMFFDADKAVRELGLPQTPVIQALERAVDWFRSHGYVKEASQRWTA